MIDCSRGAEWRKWDLHLHTPGTAKADQYGGTSWDDYISALETKDVTSLGITDYFSIENFLKVKNSQKSGKLAEKFLIPNVELRILPVTRTDTPINLHVLFDPSESTLAILEREFFRELKFKYRGNSYSCIRDDLILLGRAYTDNALLEETAAWKAGIEQFNIPFQDIKAVLDRTSLKNKYLVGVSNSNNDGNSGIQHSSLAATREEIYRFADFILSSNPRDREFFLGKGSLTAEQLIEKYGSLKPCIVGSDAHSLDSVCVFPGGRCTWLKADPSFEGLVQIILEPEDRVFIGDHPPLFDRVKLNRTRFINGLNIASTSHYAGQFGKWFENIKIPFNKELVAIIGNKGSGKSAIADIVALCSCVEKDDEIFSFLNKKKFCEKNGRVAQNFLANLEWESGYKSEAIALNSGTQSGEPGVKYISQGQFERLTNEISTADSFQAEIESVVFSHIPPSDRLDATTFSDLRAIKTASVESERLALSPALKAQCQNLLILERKRHPQYRKDLDQKLEKKLAELAALQDPNPVVDPNTDPERQKANQLVHQSIDKIREKILRIEEEIESEESNKKALAIKKTVVQNLIRDFDAEAKKVEAFIVSSQASALQAGLNIKVHELITYSFDTHLLTKTLDTINENLMDIQFRLGEIPIIEGRTAEEILTERHSTLNAELTAANSKLNDEQRAYQEYLNEKTIVEQERKRINGSPQQPDTIEYLKFEIDYLNKKLQSELESAFESCLSLAEKFYGKSAEVVQVYKEARERLNSVIHQHSGTLLEYQIMIDAGLVKDESFMTDFLAMISKNKSGTFNGSEGSEQEFKKIVAETDFDDWSSVKMMLADLYGSLKSYQKNAVNIESYIDDQVKDPIKLLEYLFSVSFVKPNYQLKQGDKTIEMLSPGERGALLLVFYLLLDKSDIPLIIDQPEDNLDNHSVATILVPFIRKAKARRQIIMVTHNPNLAVVSDAEQVIYASINKEGDYKFSIESGSIENPQINVRIVNVLEGAMKAFNTRKSKYLEAKV